MLPRMTGGGWCNRAKGSDRAGDSRVVLALAPPILLILLMLLVPVEHDICRSVLIFCLHLVTLLRRFMMVSVVHDVYLSVMILLLLLLITLFH